MLFDVLAAIKVVCFIFIWLFVHDLGWLGLIDVRSMQAWLVFDGIELSARAALRNKFSPQVKLPLSISHARRRFNAIREHCLLSLFLPCVHLIFHPP
jgi:hypothetical protein